MEKDNFKTDVMFRKERSGAFKGDIFALFPYDIYNRRGNISCYQHIGQHSEAEYYHCINTSIPAVKGEYSDLYQELKSLGYDLNVVKRRNHKRFLQALNNVRNA